MSCCSLEQSLETGRITLFFNPSASGCTIFHSLFFFFYFRGHQEILRSEGKCLQYDPVPLVLMKDILSFMPQLKYMFSNLGNHQQQQQHHPAKRAKHWRSLMLLGRRPEGGVGQIRWGVNIYLSIYRYIYIYTTINFQIPVALSFLHLQLFLSFFLQSLTLKKGYKFCDFTIELSLSFWTV